MAQIFDAPSKAILRSQIAEHIAENDNNDRRVDQEGEAPLPKDRFFDRELSWLKFNQRVLECAENEDMPLLERANFAAIFASNLDEFFMVRVAGLKRRIDSGIAVPSAAGLSPRQQLRAISETAHRLQDEHAHYTIDTILPELEKERIVLLTWDKLTSSEQERLSRYYRQQVFPVLTPLAVDPAHPFPYISGGSINLAVIVENPASGKSHFARVKIPGNLPRLVPVDDMTDEESKDERYGFIAMEKLIAAHLESLFPGMIIKEARSFRVTRNEDIDVEEDDAENLLNAMEKELLRRRFGPPIRLEITDTTSPFLSQLLADQLGVSQDEVYRLPSPLDLTVLFELGSVDRPDLKNRPFVPTTNRQIAEVESSRAQDIFAAIRERDILLHHPYDSFSTSVQAFLAQAAADPKVLAIKQTLYRTSSNSPIIDALIDAAHAGKQVLALVVIKARFDDDANIAVQPALWLRAEVQLPPSAGGPAYRAHRPDSAHPPRGGRRPRRQGGLDQDQGQLHRGREDHRRPVPCLSGRREDRHRRTRHLRSEARRSRPVREHPRTFDSRPLPGALPHLRLLQCGRPADRRGPGFRPGGLHRFG